MPETDENSEQELDASTCQKPSVNWLRYERKKSTERLPNLYRRAFVVKELYDERYKQLMSEQHIDS